MDLPAEANPSAVANWITSCGITVLNVAGPWASGAPHAHGQAAFLRAVVGLLGERKP